MVLILEELWTLLTQVTRWPSWDDGLISAALDNPAQGVRNGAQGTLVMKERGPFQFQFVDLDPCTYFAYGLIN